MKTEADYLTEELDTVTKEVISLTAENERLKAALTKIASETEDIGPPFRVMSREAMHSVARAALTEREKG